MKRLILACICILTLSACADAQNTFSNGMDYLRDIGEPAAGPEGMGVKSQSQRLIEEGQCPIVDVVPELGDFYDLQGGAVVGHATLTRTEAICSYGPKSVTIDAKLAFTGKGGSGKMTYPYFVAIMSPGGKILAKQVFAANIDYSAGGMTSQKLRQIIPIYNQKNGGSHKILFGFQLSQEQLTYNRNLIKQQQAAAKAAAIQQNKLMREHSPEQTGLQPMPTAAPLQVIDQTTTTTPPGVINAPVSPLEDGQPIILSPEEIAN